MAKAKNIHIFSGTSHPQLAAAIAHQLRLPLSKMEISRFACNEIYAKPGVTVRGADVYLIQTATEEVNEDFMELFIMIDALKRAFAANVHVIIPHYGYARQDRVATPREPITAKLMADLIAAAGADHVVAVDLHSSQAQGFFPFPVDNLHTRGLFMDYLKKKKIQNPVIVAPDAGAAKEAERMAKALGYPMAILTKSRPGFNQAEVTAVIGDVEGKTCIIFDDMVDTGGSVCAAHRALLNKGANQDVYLMASHAVFSGPAIERFKTTRFKEVIVTDTIPLPSKKQFEGLTVLSVAPMLARVIESIHENKSVTQVL
jgi:ribose-phosphate pyrophosphokinase